MGRAKVVRTLGAALVLGVVSGVGGTAAGALGEIPPPCFCYEDHYCSPAAGYVCKEDTFQNRSCYDPDAGESQYLCEMFEGPGCVIGC